MALDLFPDYFLPYSYEMMEASNLVKGLCRPTNVQGIVFLVECCGLSLLLK